MNEVQQAILKTLCYSDVYDYPLTFQQLHAYLISKKTISIKSLKNSLGSLPFIKKNGKFLYLKGRSEIVILRKRREQESILKIYEAKRIAKVLGFIPSIQFIGLSGSVAMKNCEKHHDIDLFIVTKANTLWISRFFVMSILFFMQKKRRPYDTRTENKICANMFVTTDSVRMPISKRSLYTAHEVVQVMPLINKNSTYEYFLSENKWVMNFLANWRTLHVTNFRKNNLKLLEPIDTLYFLLQRFYMRRKVTTEFVKKDAAFFHPVNYKKITNDLYKTKYRHYQNLWPTGQKNAQKKHFKLASKNNYLASIFTPGS